MKNIFFIVFFYISTNFFFSFESVKAQCPGGYTQAQLNWDNLDYYWNSGSGNTPYSNYITDAQVQNQKFAIGTTRLTIAASSVSMISPGAGNSTENALHTGELSGYTGEDVQYNPSANGQSITITFASPVSNPNFTLYDIDRSAVFTITATNDLNLPTAVNVTTYAGTILTVGGVPTSRTITASSTSLANNLNTGSATINVPGLVNTIIITINTIGSDPVFWLSDINACVAGNFPSNWHQGASNRPFWGPTQSQPDYFLVTPDNNSVYMVDPSTAVARELFSDASKSYVNSFAYDPYKRFLYFISENVSVNANNKELKRYDYNTETISTVISDISAAPLNIPIFDLGIESAGAAFYNGSLYLGIEGGRQGSSSSLRTRETIIWKIDFDGSNNPISACQVFGTDSYTNGSGSISTHDWGDFIIKNGMLYNFNTARNSSNYSESKYHHYNLMTGNVDALYNNPGSSSWNGQACMTWSGNLYYFRASSSGNSVIGTYNEAGVNGSTTNITVASGTAWPGGAGDASDPFRPKCDFGDAPASYDPYSSPATQSPAVHERSDNIRLGATWDYEFFKRGTNGTADVDDGLAYAQILSPTGGSYAVRCTTYNNSGANARLIAWLDYNGNGVFDASEACSPITVPSSASSQIFWLYWATTPNSFSNGDSTYLRVRITSQSAGMTSSHATGYFSNGEVEDYRVIVDNWPLSTKLLNFTASLQKEKVVLDWSATEESGSFIYHLERSIDNVNWIKIATIDAHRTNGTFNYSEIDEFPFVGKSYYRIRIIESSGENRFSEIKSITYSKSTISFKLAPNPAKEFTNLYIESTNKSNGVVELLNVHGSVILSKNQQLNKGENLIRLQLQNSNLNGVYVIRIKVDNEIVYQKLIINK